MSEKRITSYIIYGFNKKEISVDDWEKVKDMIPWSYFHFVNGETYVGPAISKVEGVDSVNEQVDVKFDTLAYVRRMFQESIVKDTGVYLMDSIFKVVHMTIEEFI